MPRDGTSRSQAGEVGPASKACSRRAGGRLGRGDGASAAPPPNRGAARGRPAHLDGQVVGLGGAAGEHDFLGVRADHARHLRVARARRSSRHGCGTPVLGQAALLWWRPRPPPVSGNGRERGGRLHACRCSEAARPAPWLGSTPQPHLRARRLHRVLRLPAVQVRARVRVAVLLSHEGQHGVDDARVQRGGGLRVRECARGVWVVDRRAGRAGGAAARAPAAGRKRAPRRRAAGPRQRPEQHPPACPGTWARRAAGCPSSRSPRLRTGAMRQRRQRRPWWACRRRRRRRRPPPLTLPQAARCGALQGADRRDPGAAWASGGAWRALGGPKPGSGLSSSRPDAPGSCRVGAGSAAAAAEKLRRPTWAAGAAQEPSARRPARCSVASIAAAVDWSGLRWRRC